nr:hypothetical protein CFP56_36647 [Quercus suber]
MTRHSSKAKDIVTDDPSTSVAKQTRLSSKSSRDSTIERFRTPLDSKTYTDTFREAPPIVERIVKFDTLGTTFIPKIFEERDWADLFGNFEDPIVELVKEFYSNARYTGVELKCWIIGKTTARSAAQTNLPFCSLIIKIILCEGVSPPLDGKIVSRPRPISIFTLQASKSHSSRTPKSKPSTHASPSAHATVTPLQSTGTPSVPPGFEMAKQSHLIANVFHRISDLERLLHSFHNQNQICLTTIETQLDAIQRKLEDSL